MIILVDFENTHAYGLEGYTYLNENDTLVMYYSDENSAVTRGVVEDLRKNGVHVRLVKLLKQHSNALDMYIASTTGMFLDSGEKICIVSKDHGYAAVRDFWHSLRGAEILLGETIKQCLLSSELNDEARIRLCKERERKAMLVDAFPTMNTIPTQPTLSRSSQRRRRNGSQNFTEVSEPVAILPNPLVTETPADQLAKELSSAVVKSENAVAEPQPEASKTADVRDAQKKPVAEERASQKKSSGRGANGRTQNARSTREQATQRREQNSPAEQNTTNEPVQERFGGYDGIMKMNEASRIALDQRQEREEQKAEQDEPSAAKNRNHPKQNAQTGTALTQAKQETAALVKAEKKTTAVAKVDPNRVQFVWDPVTRSMKRVGGPAEEGAEKKDDAAKTEAAEKNEEAVDKTTADHKPEKDAAADAKVNVDATEKNVADVVKDQDAADAKTADVSGSAAEKDATAEDAVAETVADAVTEKTVADPAKSEDVKQPAAEAAAVQPETVPEKTVETDITAHPVTADEEKLTAEHAESGQPAVTDEKKSEAAKKTGAHRKAKKAASVKKESEASEKPVDEKKSTKKKNTKKPVKKDSSENGKPEKSPKNDAENLSADAKDTQPVPEMTEEDIQLTKKKYSEGINTLHTYYVRLMKAFGREQGRAIYESTKKSVQEDIKARKAQLAAEATVEEEKQ